MPTSQERDTTFRSTVLCLLEEAVLRIYLEYVITFLEALWILPVWTDVNRAVHCTELRDQSNLRSKSLI